MPLVAAHLLTDADMDIEIYNGMDCMVMDEIWENMKPLEHLAGPMYQFERALQGPVLEMTMRGFRIDPVRRELGTRALRARLVRLSHIVDQLAGAVWDIIPPAPKLSKYPKPTRLNPESTQQLCKFFYEYLRIPPIIKNFKGVESMPMDRETLEKLEVYFDARLIVNTIMEYRDVVGQLEVLESEVDRDWRMRTTYGIASTDTTRFSSSKSIIGSGRNLQNIEESLRDMFVADPGKIMYGIDLEQTESREVGLICGLLFDDWSYLDACESGDLHTRVSSMCFLDLSWTGERKADREIADGNFYRHFSYRDASKKLGHASNYFGKPPNIASQTKIPVGLVKSFQHRYFDAFPCIPRYHAWCAEQIQTKHALTNVFGATRDFFDRADSEETLRSAIASLPQSQTAQRLNLGLWKIWRYMPEVELLAQLHDAVYFQADERLDPYEVAAKAISLIEIQQTLPNGRKFIIPGEVKIGKNWSTRKEDKLTGKVTNPNGLIKLKLH